MDGTFVRLIIEKAIAKCKSSARQNVLILLLFSTGCGSILPQSSQPKQRFSLASLKGNYTYNLGGTILGYGPYHETGAFVADGNGNITGVDDFSSGTTTSGRMIGSYTISGDGTGTMTISVPGRQTQLAITMRSNMEGYLLESDSFAVGDGGAFAQTTAAISPLSGAYVVRFYTHAIGGASTVAVGQMMVSGTSITGNEDVSQVGTASSSMINGSLTQPDSNGRGTLSLTDNTGNTSNYVYYRIDSNTLNLIRIDLGSVGEGRSFAQTTASFNSASMSNGFVFHQQGDTLASLGGINIVGAFTTDGNGKITSGSLDSTVNGTVTSESLTGTYNIDSRGRASITLTPAGAAPISEVAWMADSTQGFFIEQDQNVVAGGGLDEQQNGPFSAGSLKGEYAFRMVGGQNSTALGLVGVMTFDGNTKVTLADYFVNQGGVQGQNGGLSGSYTVSLNGRVSSSIGGVSNAMVFYLTSNATSYFLLADPNTETQGQNSMQVPQ